MKSKLSLLSLLIALGSLYFAYEANQIAGKARDTANSANQLAKEANELSREGNLTLLASSNYEFEKSSQQFVDTTYDSIFEDENLNRVINNLTENKKTDKNHLGKVIDIFENLGSKYCKGLIDKEQLRASFSRTLWNVCNNEQVFELFHDRKNGTALLCSQFVSNSRFGETFKQETFKTCNLND